MKYKIKGTVWLYPGEHAQWHFISLDKETSKKVKENHGKVHRGFGSIPVEVTVGETVWKTSVFPSKEGVYILPIKALVRRKEGIYDRDQINLILKFI